MEIPTRNVGHTLAAEPARVRPPRVARKSGKHVFWWPVDEGCLGSRAIGKVNIDCRLRLSESRWGVLGNSRPAGILYVDIAFNQPQHCRLSSAKVRITLEEMEDSKGKGKESDAAKLSPLRVCEIGPKILTGEPTTLDSKTELKVMPQLHSGMGGFGGVGMKRETAVRYVSRWMLKGNILSLETKRHKTSGIVYRTIEWDLNENELAFQPMEKNVVHTGFAFEHELKQFYIKVEISGRLCDAFNRFKYQAFPPRLKRHQGTAVTLVDLGPEDDARKERLDALASRLETQMRDRNLVLLPAKTAETESISQQSTQVGTEAHPHDPIGLLSLSGETEAIVSLEEIATATAARTLSRDKFETPLPVSNPPQQRQELIKTEPKEELLAPKVQERDISVDETAGGDHKLVQKDHDEPQVVQFSEVLMLLRVWAYATLFTLFMGDRRKGIAKKPPT